MRALLLALLAGCLPHPADQLGIARTYKGAGVANVTRYTRPEVKVTRRTPGGVAVDDPLVQLSDTSVDQAFAEVEACLRTMPAKWTSWQTWIMNGNCSRASVPRSIDRMAVLVKVAPDWQTSACSGRQGFPCYGDGVRAGVAAKVARGEISAEDARRCPTILCGRAVQWDFVVVTTPDLSQLKAGIVELVTGCENPWSEAMPLSACVGKVGE